MFDAARSIRWTALTAAALFGFYFLWVGLSGAAPGAWNLPQTPAFLVVLLLLGLWTRAPLTALLVTGAILAAWLAASVPRGGDGPGMVVAAAAFGAVVLGVLVRRLLFGKDADPEPPVA